MKTQKRIVALLLALVMLAALAACGKKEGKDADGQKNAPAGSGLVLLEEAAPYVSAEQRAVLEAFLKDTAGRLGDLEKSDDPDTWYAAAETIYNGYEEKAKPVVEAVGSAYAAADASAGNLFNAKCSLVSIAALDIVGDVSLKRSAGEKVTESDLENAVNKSFELFEKLAKLFFTEESVNAVYGDVLDLM